MGLFSEEHMLVVSSPAPLPRPPFFRSSSFCSLRSIFHAPCYSVLATAYALLGDFVSAKKSLHSAAVAIKETMALHHSGKVIKDGEKEEGEDEEGERGEEGGGKRAGAHIKQHPNGGGGKEPLRQRASVPLFLKMRNSEVEREGKRVREYMKRLQDKPPAGNGNETVRGHFCPLCSRTLADLLFLLYLAALCLLLTHVLVYRDSFWKVSSL